MDPSVVRIAAAVLAVAFGVLIVIRRRGRKPE